MVANNTLATQIGHQRGEEWSNGRLPGLPDMRLEGGDRAVSSPSKRVSGPTCWARNCLGPIFDARQVLQGRQGLADVNKSQAAPIGEQLWRPRIRATTM